MTTRRQSTKSSPNDDFDWTLNWMGEQHVIRIIVNKHRLTNGFRNLALTKPVDRSFRKTLTAIRSRVRTKLRLSVKGANQFVAEMRAQMGLAVVDNYFLPFLKEDVADLLSICSCIATDTIAGRQGLPRDTPRDFLKSLHEHRKERIKLVFKTGRKRGQTGSRNPSQRERHNRDKRLERTLAAITRVENSARNLTRKAVAKEIGISVRQFGQVWLPDLLKSTGCKNWEQFITRKNRNRLTRELKGSQKLA